jgi:hypothetical protein
MSKSYDLVSSKHFKGEALKEGGNVVPLAQHTTCMTYKMIPPLCPMGSKGLVEPYKSM